MNAGFSAGRDPQERKDIVRSQVVADYSYKFLALISHGSDRDARLLSFLHQIDSTLTPAESKLVVNATIPDKQQGVAYFLASQQQLFSPAGLTMLLKLGLNLESTFPMVIERERRTTTIDGVNIFHCAGMYGRSDLIQALPVMPRLQNARTSSGETPAIFTLKYAHDNYHAVRGLEALHQKGINLAARDNQDRQLFHYAFRFRQNALLKCLIKFWQESDSALVSSQEVRSAMALTILTADQKGFKTAGRRLSLLQGIECAPQARETMVLGVQAALFRNIDHYRDSRSRSLQVMLNRLYDRIEQISPELTSTLMNMRVPRSEDQTFFSRLCTETSSGRLVTSALRLGADSSAPFTSRNERTGELTSAPAIHHAAINENIEVLNALLEWERHTVNRLDLAENTPLMAHITTHMNDLSSRINRDLVYDLLSHGTDMSIRNSDNLDVCDLAIRVGDLETLLLLLNEGAQVPEADRHRRFESKTSNYSLDFRELTYEAVMYLRKIEQLPYEGRAEEILQESREILSHTRSVYQTYLYLIACHDMIEQDLNIRTEPGGGQSLLALSQSFLFRPPPSRLGALWRLAEHVSDADEPIKNLGFHQNESEMMLLLNSPGAEKLRPDELNPLTRALTSITRFIDADIPTLGGLPVWNFARIGLYTHGFHQVLRFDSQGEWDYSPRSGWRKSGPSLLESQFGFFPVAANTPLTTDFGPAFIYLTGGESVLAPSLLSGRDGTLREYNFEAESILVFARGIIALAHPEWGQLIIRNSSRTFGRDLLRHAAYWSPPPDQGKVKVSDLLALTIDRVEELYTPVLEPYLYRSSGVEIPAEESIYELLRQLDVFRDHHRRSSFDTDSRTAFTMQDGSAVLCESGGYRAPNFAGRVAFLERRFEAVQNEIAHKGESSREIPDLLFSRPFYPAWTGYRFLKDDQFHSRLKIDADVLTSLRAYADGHFTNRTHDLALETGVHAFFQQAGFDHHGELVMVGAR